MAEDIIHWWWWWWRRWRGDMIGNWLTFHVWKIYISIHLYQFLQLPSNPSLSLYIFVYLSSYLYLRLSLYLSGRSVYSSVYLFTYHIYRPNYWHLKPAVLMKLRWGNSFQRCWRMAPRQLSRRPALHDTDAKILGDRPSIHQYLQSVMNIPDLQDPRFSIHQHSPTIPTIPTIIETDLKLHKLFTEAEATTKEDDFLFKRMTRMMPQWFTAGYHWTSTWNRDTCP